MSPLMAPCWESDDVDRTPTHNTHLCFTVCSHARNAHHALGSSHTDCSVIFARLKRNCHLVLHMSHLLLFSHLPFATSTSSSSFTLPSNTTQEHAAQLHKVCHYGPNDKQYQVHPRCQGPQRAQEILFLRWERESEKRSAIVPTSRVDFLKSWLSVVENAATR